MAATRKRIAGFGNGDSKYPRMSPDLHILQNVIMAPSSELKENVVTVRFDLKVGYNQLCRSEESERLIF
jgi:hypothetical protein